MDVSSDGSMKGHIKHYGSGTKRWTNEGAMDTTSGAIEGVMDVTSDGSWL